MAYWLLIRGTGGHPLPPEVRPEQLRSQHSTRRPSIQLGDLAVCYASVWQVIFALVEVVSHPENDPGRTRWQWRFALRPTLVLPDLHEAPPVEAAGVLPRSLGRHSYVRLSAEQYELARRALEDAARPPRAPAGEGSGRAREQHWAPAAGEIERGRGEGDDDEGGEGGDEGDADHTYPTGRAPPIFP